MLVTVPAAQPDVRTTRTELAKQAFADAAVNATEKVSVDLTERNSRLLQSPIIRNEKKTAKAVHVRTPLIDGDAPRDTVKHCGSTPIIEHLSACLSVCAHGGEACYSLRV